MENYYLPSEIKGKEKSLNSGVKGRICNWWLGCWGTGRSVAVADLRAGHVRSGQSV